MAASSVLLPTSATSSEGFVPLEVIAERASAAAATAATTTTMTTNGLVVLGSNDRHSVTPITTIDARRAGVSSATSAARPSDASGSSSGSVMRKRRIADSEDNDDDVDDRVDGSENVSETGQETITRGRRRRRERATIDGSGLDQALHSDADADAVVESQAPVSPILSSSAPTPPRKPPPVPAARDRSRSTSRPRARTSSTCGKRALLPLPLVLHDQVETPRKSAASAMPQLTSSPGRGGGETQGAIFADGEDVVLEHGHPRKLLGTKMQSRIGCQLEKMEAEEMTNRAVTKISDDDRDELRIANARAEAATRTPSLASSPLSSCASSVIAEEEAGGAFIDHRDNKPTGNVIQQKKRPRQEEDALDDADDNESSPRCRNRRAGTSADDDVKEDRDRPTTKRARPSSDLSQSFQRPKKASAPSSLSSSAPARIIVTTAEGKLVEYQSKTCNALRKSVLGALSCNACIARKTGVSCSFKGFRCWDVDEAGKIISEPYFTSIPLPEDSPLGGRLPLTVDDFPSTFNRPLTEADRLCTLRSCIAPLLELLTREARHANRPNALLKPNVDLLNGRSICDFCHTTVFAGTWFCSCCGREYCLDCLDLFIDPSKRPNALVVTRLQRCRGNSRPHSAADLIPTSTLSLSTLREQLARLVAFALATRQNRLDDNELEDLLPVESTESDAVQDREKNGLKGDEDCDTQDTVHAQQAKERCLALKEDRRVEAVRAKRSEANGQSPQQPLDTGTLSHDIIYASIDELNTGDLMRGLWEQGEPMLIHGVTPTLDWSASAFVNRTVDEECFVQDCKSNQQYRYKVSEFFEQIAGERERVEGVWKLKDWPTDQTFAKRFPDLYNDFIDFVPAPDYSRHDGALNIFGRFPNNVEAPDLGPKMYVAYAGNDKPGGSGSTRLHMDIADAVNVLVSAGRDDTGEPGGAVWDIYRPEDAHAIRRFLRERFPGKSRDDPIHDQIFFLDSDLRRELHDGYGVKSYRVFQREGEAVFVPAGCAHQVCNLSDCIKIATDFVSPRSVERCRGLMKEFQGLNMARAWKEDVLQFYNTLW